MQRRFVSVWFRDLAVDWMQRKNAQLRLEPFALIENYKGQPYISAANALAAKEGILPAMRLNDAKALCPALQTFEQSQERDLKLLNALADWCIRYTPYASVCKPDGLWLDVTGCCHLLGGEKPFLKDLVTRLIGFGYNARAAMADTPGCAWAVARYGTERPIIPIGGSKAAILNLPPSALRIERDLAKTLQRLGLNTVADIIAIPRPQIARRFGQELIQRIDQACGDLREPITPKMPPPVYSVRLNCLEPVATAEAIAIATCNLLGKLCTQLEQDHKGIRELCLSCFRVDGFVQHVTIGTGMPSKDADHLFRLFKEKLSTIAPGLGLELFMMDAVITEPLSGIQETLTAQRSKGEYAAIAELVDRLSNRLGRSAICRYDPVESYLPERAVKRIAVTQLPSEEWPTQFERPIHILQRPEKIDVFALAPDYPPKMFKHRGNTHRIKKANGPERIEAEWWHKTGNLRDYYRLEDEQGRRYWVFRAGAYQQQSRTDWYLHGFFG